MREDHLTVPGEMKALSKGNAFSSIQGKLVGLLLLVLVPILVSQAYFSYDRYQFRKKIECSANLELAQATAKAFDTFVQDVLHQELAIGLAFTSSQTLSDIEKSRILFDNQAGNSAIWNFFWNDPAGIATAATGSQFIGIDISDREFYREIVAGKEWVVSDLILSKTTQQPIFTISRGIRNERGELLGIIVAGILAAQLDRVLAVERIGDAGVSLLDSKGMHVYQYPAVQYTWEQRNWLKLYPSLEEVLKGKEVVISSHESKIQRGSKRIVAFTPVPSIGWIASCSRAEEEVVGPIISDTLQETGLILLVALGSLLIAVTLSRTISSSVKTLRNYALSLGQGGAQNPLSIAGPAEIKDLAEAFNQMAEEISFREMALRESEERLAFATSATRIGMFDWHLEGATILWTQTHEEIFGYAPAVTTTTEHPYHRWADRVHPEDLPLVEEESRCCMRDRKLLEVQYRIIWPDGSLHWVETRGIFRFNTDGKADRMLGVVMDITERKRAEEERRRSQQTLFEVIEGSPFGTYIVNAQFRIAQMNASSQIGAFRNVRPVIGRPLDEAMRTLWPEDVAAEIIGHFRHTLDTGEPYYSRDFINPRNDGGIVEAYEWELHRMELPDGYGVICYYFDSTKLREAEEALRQSDRRERERGEELATILDAVPTPVIIVHDPEATHMTGNRAADELLRQPSGVEISLSAPSEVKPSHFKAIKDERELTLDELPAQRAARGEHVRDFEFDLVFDDGTTRHLLSYGTPLMDEQSRPRGAVHVLVDITERKQAEEQLHKSLAEKEAMLKEIHHRVKNNLQVISSLVSLQADTLTDERIREELNDVRDRVRSMALIHEKLYQARDLAQLDFADYATSLMHTLWRSHSALAKNVSLNLAVEPVSISIETAVPCGLILNELAGNALKHAFPNNSSGEVEVGFGIDPATKMVCLRVRDNGVGLPAGFDWSQSEALGLQLVKILAGQLRGTVETETGPGTEFKIIFPLKENEHG